MATPTRRINGSAVKALRKARGIRVTDLALAVGISTGALCNIEAGRKTCSPDRFQAIADALSHGIPDPKDHIAVDAITYPWMEAVA